MFSWKVMTVLSSPRRLDLVLMPQNRNQRVTSAVTGRSLALLLVLDYWYGWGQDKTSQHVSLVPRPTLQGRRVWEITLLGAVQLECDGFWIQQTPLSDLQHDWSFATPIFKISTFYRLVRLCAQCSASVNVKKAECVCGHAICKRRSIGTKERKIAKDN